MADEQDSVLKILVELVDKVSQPLQQISEGFEQFESGIWDLSKAFASAFLGYELFEHLAEPAAEFQEAQVRLALATRGSAEELKKFKEQAEELSQTYPSDIENVTAAQTLLYQTFKDDKTVLEATEQADRLATALGWKATDAANTLASAYENLAPKGADVTSTMKEFADKLVLLNTQFPSITSNTSMMARDFARLGASAKTYGIGINQVLALLGELNQLHAGGTRGSGMIAQELVRSLAEVDKNGIPTLARYGLVIDKDTKGNILLIDTLDRLAKMAHTHPMAFHNLLAHLPEEGQYIAQLVDHIDDLKNAYGQFENAAGSTDNAVKLQTQTFENQSTAFKNSLTNLKELFGILALPQLTEALKSLTGLVSMMEKFSNNHSKISTAIADFFIFSSAAITAVGALGFLGKGLAFVWETATHLPIISSMLGDLTAALSLLATEGIGSLGAVFGELLASNPIGWIIAGVALIALGSYEVYKHWESIKSAIGDAHVELDRFLRAFGVSPHQREEFFSGIWNHIPSVWAYHQFSGAAGAASHAMTFAPHIEVHGGTAESAAAIRQQVGSVLESMKDDLESLWRSWLYNDTRSGFSNRTGGSD